MQCEQAYQKDGIRGLLCRKAEEPKVGDLKAEAHALCGNQRFCPNERCFRMLPGWEKCPKRLKSKQEAAGEPKKNGAGNDSQSKKTEQKRRK